MNRNTSKNIAASVRQRLLDKARATQRPFSEVLQYFAMERFLYRLSNSPYEDRFILKGALLLNTWKVPFSRSTMDIDLLGRMSNDINAVVTVVRDVCLQKVEDDGMVFDPASAEGVRITEDADYSGVRVRFQGCLDTARVVMQIDIGFGDVITSGPDIIDYPTILDFPAPRLHGYSKESVVAEKFEAMVKFGILNSRMKDFYDIWILLRQFGFDGTMLTSAVKNTLANRNTEKGGYPLNASGPHMLCFLWTICRYGNGAVITACSMRR